MNKQEVVIFGISKVADIVYSSILDDEKASIIPVAFCVDRDYKDCTEKNGLPVVEFEDVEKYYPSEKYKMIIAIGYHKMNEVRAKKCVEAMEKGYELVSFIHSGADVPGNVEIGYNTIILNKASVGPYSKVGNNVCIYNNATVAHHSVVGNNVWITSGTVIGGNTSIGDNCFLGIHSTIGHNISIGKNNFVGAGSLITKSTDDDSVYIVSDTPKYRLNTEMFMKLFRFD